MSHSTSGWCFFALFFSILFGWLFSWTRYSFSLWKRQTFLYVNISCLQHIYSEDDCMFREQVQPDGYNIYISVRHGVLLSLGSHRQRLTGRDRDTPSLAQFLPRISTLEQSSYVGHHASDQPAQSTDQKQHPVDSMDSFGKLSQIIHSPSFHKRWDRCSGISVTGCILGCSKLEHSWCTLSAMLKR